MELMAVKKNSDTISTLPLRVMTVLLSVDVMVSAVDDAASVSLLRFFVRHCDRRRRQKPNGYFSAQRMTNYDVTFIYVRHSVEFLREFQYWTAKKSDDHTKASHHGVSSSPSQGCRYICPTTIVYIGASHCC